MFEPGLLKSVLLTLGLLALPGLAAAAGKCERLVATGNPDYPPYLWRDPQHPQQLIGASADLLQHLAKELGVTVDILYSGPWAQAQDELRMGRVDLLAGAPLTASGLEVMDYVHPALYFTPNVVWVRRGAEFPYSAWQDLHGRKGDSLLGSSFGAAFDTYAKNNLSLEGNSSLTQAFQKLLLGQSDYVLHERYPGQALADTLSMQDDLVALEPPISSDALHLTLSHNSACNAPWLRGSLARKMLEAVAAGLPETLLQRNLQRWKAQQLTPVGDVKQ